MDSKTNGPNNYGHSFNIARPPSYYGADRRRTGWSFRFIDVKGRGRDCWEFSGQPETKRVCWGPLETRNDAGNTLNSRRVAIVGPELKIITRAPQGSKIFLEKLRAEPRDVPSHKSIFWARTCNTIPVRKLCGPRLVDSPRIASNQPGLPFRWLHENCPVLRSRCSSWYQV